MLYLYISSILLINILCRLRDDIYTIEKQLLSDLPKLALSLNISGTNGFSYKFEKQKIYFNYRDIYTDNINNIILIDNPNIKIIFYLTIYEYCNDLFDLNYLKSALINEKTIIVDINFKDIKYFQKKSDFSFDVLFNIENLKNNMTIHFDNLNEKDIFKYLIYEEESALYDNQTFVEYEKLLTLNNSTKLLFTTLPILLPGLLFYNKK